MPDGETVTLQRQDVQALLRVREGGMWSGGHTTTWNADARTHAHNVDSCNLCAAYRRVWRALRQSYTYGRS